jgi:hypothetical protein
VHRSIQSEGRDRDKGEQVEQARDERSLPQRGRRKWSCRRGLVGGHVLLLVRSGSLSSLKVATAQGRIQLAPSPCLGHQITCDAFRRHDSRHPSAQHSPCQQRRWPSRQLYPVTAVLACAYRLRFDLDATTGVDTPLIEPSCAASGEHSELIEAKSLSDHTYVRQALAQLLDYGPALPEVPTAAAALFPGRPSKRGIELLHRYGIDCIYRTGPRSFRREPAPQAARDRL